MNFTPKLKGKFTYSSKEYGNMALTSSAHTENTPRSIKASNKKQPNSPKAKIQEFGNI